MNANKNSTDMAYVCHVYFWFPKYIRIMAAKKNIDNTRNMNAI